MFKDFKNRIGDKRYQELSKPYRILLWIRYMPYGHIKGLGWYFVKRLRWEDVGDDEDCGRISLGTCIGICVGMSQGDMRWYYKTEEVFTKDGGLIRRSENKGFLEKMLDFFGEKIIEMIDGKKTYD
jgi:hypothetical protein